MHLSSRVHRRRVLAGAASALLGATLVLTGTPVAQAVEDVKSERIAGANRFETAAEVAAAAFPTGSDTVIVASGRAFPDALAGAALGLPILLTERDTLPSATASALDDLGATDAIILGGTAAVSTAVENAIEDHASVSRVAGLDRYETAADIATSVGAANVGEVDTLVTGIIATGFGFADALAGGPLATGGPDTLPVLLVSNEVPAATEAAIDALGIEQVLILGGSAAVSSAVEADLEALTGNPAVRLAGANRFSTAVEVAEWGIENLDFLAKKTLLASGADFADALAGGPLGGVQQAPILLTNPVQLPDESDAFFEEHSDTIDTITTLGGTAAVSTSAAAAAEAAAETPAAAKGNETITVTPTADVDLANGSTREFKATNVTGDVDIALLDCALVSTRADGDTVFVNSNNNLILDGSSRIRNNPPDEADTPSYISSVNGEPTPLDPGHDAVNDDFADDVAPDAGTVTFVVTGPSGLSNNTSCFVAVVYHDQNSDDGLNTAAAAGVVPDEPFGTAGRTTFSPGAAGQGTFVVDVRDSRDSINRFVGCHIINEDVTEAVDTNDCATFSYDDNDRFQLDGQATNLAVFESTLTYSDNVKGTYYPTTASVSIFNLYQDEGPEAPGQPTATTTHQGGTFTFSDSPTASNDQYRLYRVVKPGETVPGGDATCPSFTALAHTLAAQVNDRWTSTSPPNDPPTIIDTTASPSTRYCYRVIPVDDGDEGIPSAARDVLTLAGPATGAPTILTAKGASVDGTPPITLTNGDVHQFTFSEAMTQDATANTTYDVRDNDSPNPATAKITCGGSTSPSNASCFWVNGTTLRVEMTATPGPGSGLTNPGIDGVLNYPLTITATTFKDFGGANATLFGSDTSIENNTLEVVSPYISSAKMTTDNPTPGWGNVGDVMAVTFSEQITLNDADGSLTVDQVKAILDDQNLAYAVGTVVTGTVPAGGSVLSLTVSGVDLTNGVEIGDVVDGTSNNNIIDLAGNPQVPNPDALPPVLTAV